MPLQQELERQQLRLHYRRKLRVRGPSTSKESSKVHGSGARALSWRPGLRRPDVFAILSIPRSRSTTPTLLHYTTPEYVGRRADDGDYILERSFHLYSGLWDDTDLRSHVSVTAALARSHASSAPPSMPLHLHSTPEAVRIDASGTDEARSETGGSARGGHPDVLKGPKAHHGTPPNGYPRFGLLPGSKISFANVTLSSTAEGIRITRPRGKCKEEQVARK